MWHTQYACAHVHLSILYYENNMYYAPKAWTWDVYITESEEGYTHTVKITLNIPNTSKMAKLYYISEKWVSHPSPYHTLLIIWITFTSALQPHRRNWISVPPLTGHMRLRGCLTFWASLLVRTWEKHGTPPPRAAVRSKREGTCAWSVCRACR